MWDWLLVSIDPLRNHAVGFEVSWHGRLMVFAWCFLIPLGIMAARFFKVLPNQDWPNELDNEIWWRVHQTFQYLGFTLMLIGLFLILKVSTGTSMSKGAVFLHHLVGWTTIGLCCAQVLAGLLRGSKGGPSEVGVTGTIRGDHYDMTPRRKWFESFHKVFGYICLAIALCAVFVGLWISNAPRWMWIILSLWWCIVIFCFVKMQSKGKVIDTYQAIWGVDPELPGNKIDPIGYGIRKIK